MTENPTPEQLEALWKACVSWVKKAKPLCVESIYQTDRVQELLPDLGSAVCKVVGYVDLPEE
jgi:hypothetical protein